MPETEEFKFPSVEEISKSPAFPTAIWELEPHQKGLLPVAVGRGGPLNISWEIHGDGPIKFLLINGLGIFNTSWQRQTLHFGHNKGTEYSVLIIDNRGMGKSSRPIMRYSTSEMARDVLEVLDHVGWTTERQVHVCGSSMGGMIAQELACLAPSRVASLSLLGTAAVIENNTTFSENLANRLRMLAPKSVDRSVRYTAEACFARAWLPRPDDAELPDEHRTPRCRFPPGGYRRFESNYARFAAQDITKQRDRVGFTKLGFLLQAVAAGWHHKSPAQLREMADAVGRDRILVLHGTEDGMIPVPHGRKLIKYIQPGKGLIEEGVGHAPFVERTRWFNELIEEMCATGERLSRR